MIMFYCPESNQTEAYSSHIHNAVHEHMIWKMYFACVSWCESNKQIGMRQQDIDSLFRSEFEMSNIEN